MCGKAKGLAKKIVNVFKKAWDAIRPVLAIVLFVMALFFPVVLPFLTANLPAAVVTALTSTFGYAAGGNIWAAFAVRAVIGLGIAMLIDPETGADIVEAIVDVVGSIATAAGEIIGAGVGGLAGGLFSSPFGIVALGLGAWVLLSGSGAAGAVVAAKAVDDDEEDEEDEANRNPNQAALSNDAIDDDLDSSDSFDEGMVTI